MEMNKSNAQINPPIPHRREAAFASRPQMPVAPKHWNKLKTQNRTIQPDPANHPYRAITESITYTNPARAQETNQIPGTKIPRTATLNPTTPPPKRSGIARSVHPQSTRRDGRRGGGAHRGQEARRRDDRRSQTSIEGALLPLPLFGVVWFRDWGVRRDAVTERGAGAIGTETIGRRGGVVTAPPEVRAPRLHGACSFGSLPISSLPRRLNSLTLWVH